MIASTFLATRGDEKRAPELCPRIGTAREGKVLTEAEKRIVLSKVMSLSTLPGPLLAKASAALEEIHVPAGETIIKKGDLDTSMYIIVSGRVNVHDEEKLMTVLEDHDVFGELATLDSNERTASVTAVIDTLLLKMENEVLIGLVSGSSAVARGVIRFLCNRFRRSLRDQDRIIIERTDELAEANDKLVAQERMITETHLAGGMAHEIKNTLGAAKLRLNKIVTQNQAAQNIEHLKNIIDQADNAGNLSDDFRRQLAGSVRKIYENEKNFQKTFQEVLNSIDSCLEVTNRVMEYSRIQVIRTDEKIDLRTVLEELASTYEDDLSGNEIELHLDLRGGLDVYGTAGSFRSIFQNLIINARDAILAKGDGGGRIDITGECNESVVVFEVMDTGVGIPEKDLDKVFRPFYSTKPSTGMGLGLSECQKLVSQHGGGIEVKSGSDQGALFRIIFPVQKPS